MEGLIITSKGIENIASLDAKELINADSRIEEGCIVFDFKDLKDLCLLCYKCQSADKVMYLIGSFEFNDLLGELEVFINKSNLNGWFHKHKHFKVECIRRGNHNFKSVDVETKAYEFILKKGKGIKVELRAYEIIFLVYVINNKCYFGVDFSGFELNKRGYKIYLHPNSLRGTIAYALVRESKFKKKDLMLDPFSRDGVIAIESAFYAADFPYNYYKKDKFAFLRLNIGIDFGNFFKSIDKNIKKSKANIYSFDRLFKYVDYSKKNAKIAGVDKQISFSRTELEWLDIKFKEGSINKVITNLPTSKNIDLNKIYKEFFYQCDYILKKEGTLALISDMPDFVKKYAENYSFSVAKEKEIWSGERSLRITIFKKKNI